MVGPRVTLVFAFRDETSSPTSSSGVIMSSKYLIAFMYNHVCYKCKILLGMEPTTPLFSLELVGMHDS